MQYMYEYLFIVSALLLLFSVYSVTSILVVFGERVIMVICVYWTDFSAREYRAIIISITQAAFLYICCLKLQYEQYVSLHHQ
jgi:hypothetical protein